MLAKLWILFVVSGALLSSQVEARTTSPFNPPEEKLGIYVANAGPGLDTGCTFRGGGPLIIKVNVPKVVNEKQIGSDGILTNPQKLVTNGVLSAQAVIRFPVFDIDDKAVTNGSFAPEVDRVSFNGKFKKTLEGFNNTWTDDALVVPIEEIKFGRDNELRVDIDTANVGNGELWCMAVDWVSVEFEVTPPYILQHGISADATTWDDASAPRVIGTLEDRGVLFTRFSLSQAQGVTGASPRTRSN